MPMKYYLHDLWRTVASDCIHVLLSTSLQKTGSKKNKVFKQFKKYIYQAFDAAAMLLMLFTGQLVLISVKNPN